MARSWGGTGIPPLAPAAAPDPAPPPPPSAILRATDTAAKASPAPPLRYRAERKQVAEADGPSCSVPIRLPTVRAPGCHRPCASDLRLLSHTR